MHTLHTCMNTCISTYIHDIKLCMYIQHERRSKHNKQRDTSNNVIADSVGNILRNVQITPELKNENRISMSFG